MATVTITGATVRDVTGTPDNRPWYLAAVTYQDGHDGGVITPKRSQALLPIAGMLSFDAEPGITVRVQNPDGDFWYVTIPEEDIDLWDLIEDAVAYPPDTSSQQLANALLTYLHSDFGQFAGAHLDDEGKVQFTWLGEDIGDPMDMHLYELGSIDGGSPSDESDEILDGGTP